MAVGIELAGSASGAVVFPQFFWLATLEQLTDGTWVPGINSQGSTIRTAAIERLERFELHFVTIVRWQPGEVNDLDLRPCSGQAPGIHQ